MGYRSFENTRELAVSPEELWPYVIDPISLAGEGRHPVEAEAETPINGAVGDTWIERHGPECDNDVVRWSVTRCEPKRLYEFRGSQRGVAQRVTYSIEPTADGKGSVVTERIVFSLGFAGKPTQHILPWILLVTGILARVGDEGNEDILLAAEQHILSSR